MAKVLSNYGKEQLKSKFVKSDIPIEWDVVEKKKKRRGFR
jgi:hypothetical protein